MSNLQEYLLTQHPFQI